MTDLGAAWNNRPSGYAPSVWALMLALDRLPWPFGEDVFTACFVARNLVKPDRLRLALGWAASQPGTSRWRLATRLCVRHGRFLARSGLLGVRDPNALRRLFRLCGEEHLDAARRPVLFLGFHLGPSNTYLGLRVAGRCLTWIGGGGASGAWSHAIRQAYQIPEETRFFTHGPQAWVRRLHQAHRMLRQGENIFISGDDLHEGAFRVPLPGGPMAIAHGWLTLRRTTDVTVLPVLSHMEGRTQVVTVHAPLPPRDPDEAHDLARCRHALTCVLGDYVSRFPDHCYSLAFPVPMIRPSAR